MPAPVIDTCLHHRWKDESEIHPYLEPGWREYVGTPGSHPSGLGARRLVPEHRYPNPSGDDRADARPRGGGSAGSDVDFLIEQALDPGGIERALLLFDRGMFAPSHPSPFFAKAVVSAINDWNIDRWLSQDPRLYGAVLVTDQHPTDAAAEIRRIGSHAKIAGVLLTAPTIGRLFGHPIYNPIYEAAIELDLPIIIHRGGDGLSDAPTGTAGGAPQTFAEYMVSAPLAVQTQVMSLITNGVFAKYPELRVYVVGAGISWMQGFCQRLEQLWRALRRDLPWVRDSPTEYLHRHVRVSTYGLERGIDPATFARMVKANPEYELLLCYGSGYPSWDSGGAAEIGKLFPAAWQSAILHDNAARWLRWTAAMPAGPAVAAAR